MGSVLRHALEHHMLREGHHAQGLLERVTSFEFSLEVLVSSLLHSLVHEDLKPENILLQSKAMRSQSCVRCDTQRLIVPKTLKGYQAGGVWQGDRHLGCRSGLHQLDIPLSTSESITEQLDSPA
eukprot:2049713-Amphidinium_carterae.1